MFGGAVPQSELKGWPVDIPLIYGARAKLKAARAARALARRSQERNTAKKTRMAEFRIREHCGTNGG